MDAARVAAVCDQQNFQRLPFDAISRCFLALHPGQSTSCARQPGGNIIPNMTKAAPTILPDPLARHAADFA